MADTRIRRTARGDDRVNRNQGEGAHSRFLKTAPSLVALLGIASDTGKTDKQLFNELLADDSPEPKRKNKKTSKKNTNKKNNKKCKNNKKSPKKNAAKKKGKGKATKKDKGKPVELKDNHSKKIKDDPNLKPSKLAKTSNGKKKKKKKKTVRKHLQFAEVKTTTTSVPNNLDLLKKRAQAELRRLADENDELFHEKETLHIKLTDLQHELQSLKENMSNNEGYKEASDRLRLMVENYKSELTTLQTECIMLRELLSEYQNANKPDSEKSPVPTVDDADSREKMEAVKKLVKEKNDILNEFEELKLMYSDVMKDNATFKKELTDCKSQIKLLHDKLTNEQNRYLRENERNAERIDKLTEDMKMSKDELLVEYERKEQQFIQTVEEQLKYIDELENENEDLQQYHTRTVSIDNTGGGMRSLLKLKTQANIFAPSSGHSKYDDDDDGSKEYSMSFDDQYEILDDEYGDYGAYSPYSPGDGTYIEHGQSDDVGDMTTLVHHRPTNSILSGGDFSEAGYATPINTGAMSSYWDQVQAAKHKELDEAERMKHEEEMKRMEESEEEERKKKEEIAAAAQQQDELDQKAFSVLVGKMKELNKPIEQTGIRALGYFVNGRGRLLPLSLEKNEEDKKEKEKEKGDETEENKEDLTAVEKNEEEKVKDEEEEYDIGLLSMSLDEHVFEQLKNALTIYLFDTLLKYYKFRPKQIGNTSTRKKKKLIQIDYSYKTLLFSSNFSKSDTLFVIIPPYRGGICYWNLCIDKGIVYGTLLPYIELALSHNKGKCSTLILDPKGIDSNDTPWSIFKIYDKFIAKRIRSGKLKNIVFIGALKEGNLISHLLDRRGKELQKVVKCCVFLGCGDPYMTKPLTATIYEKCAVNYINSTLPLGETETGTKPNGDKYFIPRKSAGIANFCCIAAYSAVAEYVKKALA